MSDPIQQTAHDASSKKKHAVAKGYYTDPYIKLFARDAAFMNSPLINRGQWMRVKTVEYTVSRFAQSHYLAASGQPVPEDPLVAAETAKEALRGKPIQVISIGAGMDTLFFRWAGNGGVLDGSPAPAPAESTSSSTPAPSATLGSDSSTSTAGDVTSPNPLPLNIVKYVEVDVPEMVQLKQGRIKGSSVLSDLVNQHKGRYHLLEGDLMDSEDLVAMLKPIIDPSIPTIVIGEMVFVYFRASVSTKLLKQLSTGLFAGRDTLTAYVYDAINPTSRFGQIMLENLENRGIKLKGIHDLPSVASHVERLESCGFPSVRGLTMEQLHNSVPQDIKAKLSRIEMVDDWEEWALVMSHYVVCVASQRPGGPDGVVPTTYPPSAPVKIPVGLPLVD